MKFSFLWNTCACEKKTAETLKPVIQKYIFMHKIRCDIQLYYYYYYCNYNRITERKVNNIDTVRVTEQIINLIEYAYSKVI